MDDIEPYALAVLVAAAALLVAVHANRLTGVIRIPAPAIFLVVAAVASDLVPSLGSLSILADQRIVTIALAVILFDGGMGIGWKRLRPVVGAVAWLGVAGTVVTAAALAVAAYYVFGFDARAALLVGAALAPTDPAVVFSVLGGREIAGRSGTLLEGESGANDPVGIALMVSLLGASSAGWSEIGNGVGQFAKEMALGVGFGVVGGLLLRELMRRVKLPSPTLYPVQAIAAALILYGATATVGGSGFLAVFIAGIVIGDVQEARIRLTRQFVGTLSSLAEVVAFVVLGLSVSVSSVFTGDRVLIGLGMAALLVLVARPLLVGAVLAPVRLPRGERWFALLAGLKGAVPILLGTYVLSADVRHAERIYDVIFVVVFVTVVVQGGLVPTLIRVLRVPVGAQDS